MKFKEWLINESFDKISDFLLNPEHRDKDWNALMDEFEKSGGKVLGYGSKGSVYEHPSWNYVLKMFYDDEFYIRFIRFVIQNRHPSFPKIFSLQRIVPFFKRYPTQEKMYIVRMEKLNPISRDLFKELEFNLDRGVSYIKDLKAGTADRTEEVIASREKRKAGIRYEYVPVHGYVLEVLKKHPNFYYVFEGMYLLHNSGLKGAWDIHRENLMQRTNGEIVITDPLWGGSNPYADHKRMMDMETDNFMDEEPTPPTLLGGKLYKKPKPKKVVPIKYNVKDDDVPF